MNRLPAYVADLEKYSAIVARMTASGRDAFYANIEAQLAVERCYIVIGEAVKRLPQILLDKFPAVDWRTVKGFRDFLIHRYNEIDLDRVWAAVEQLPALRAAVEAMASDPLVTADDDEA